MLICSFAVKADPSCPRSRKGEGVEGKVPRLVSENPKSRA
jgi:hypothetical protein